MTFSFFPPPSLGFQRNYNLYPDIGIEGMIDDSIPHDVITVSNNSNAVAQVSKIVTGTAANNTEYDVTFWRSQGQLDPITISFTTDGTATSAKLQSGLMAAIQSNPRLGEFFVASTTGNDILITARVAGAAGQFSLSTANGGTGFISNQVTAPSDPSVIPFGRVLWQRPQDTGRNVTVINDVLANGTIRGISVRTEVHESPWWGNALGYYPQAEVNCLVKGRIQIIPVTNMYPGGPIYIYTTGANQGRFSGSADGSNNVLYTGQGLMIYEAATAGQISKMMVNLP